MMRLSRVGLVALVFFGTVSIAGTQMAPIALSIVRNDTTSPITIEYHKQDSWTQLPIDAQKDADISGDRVRVATTRDDKALLTVDMPIEGGKKYRLFWNKKTSMWDFSSVR